MISDAARPNGRVIMQSTIFFECSQCHHAISEGVFVPETNMDYNDGSFSSEDIDCPNCRRTHNVNINNRGGLMLVSVDGVPLKDGSVSAPDPMSDHHERLEDKWLKDYEWYLSVSQQTVHEYFTSSIGSLQSMLSIQIDDRHQAEVFNRMLLVQSVASMESYLSDTLISRIIKDPLRLQRLFESDKDLKGTRYSMLSFLSDNELPKKVAKSHLSSLIYHNLPKIERLYLDILDIEFDYGSKAEKQELLQAIQIRHDCVHRNGKSKESGHLRSIDKAYVTYVAEKLEKFVNAIENTLQADDDIPF